ncbi:MAG: F0F1 ATP synthase subunit epsilon [Desulfobacterales bacterium]|jgi:F-type H+-transporting ATPase subunit epsilon|nr:F0F1 ATP synthase subunit epsilon [Desulfobacterales bacterium]
MAGPIRLEIVTPEKIVVNEDAQIVVAPGVLGEFGVLIGHTPFLTALKTGAVRYTDTQGAEHVVFVSGGFAEALPTKVTVLAESAERRRDIDLERARAAAERARKRLAEQRSKDEMDFIRTQAALQRALQRMKIAEKR